MELEYTAGRYRGTGNLTLEQKEWKWYYSKSLHSHSLTTEGVVPERTGEREPSKQTDGYQAYIRPRICKYCSGIPSGFTTAHFLTLRKLQ